MNKALKTCTVTWTWDSGDPYSLRGFNIAITPVGQGVHPDTHAVVRGFAGPNARSYEFQNVLLDLTQTYDAWVQAVYEGKDSDWVNVGGVAVSDDGTATIPPKYSAVSGSRWELEEGQYFRLYDDAGNVVFEVSLTGATVGDVRIGEPDLGNGILWDKSTQTMQVGGSVKIGGKYASDLETITGAQQKADTAEANAKAASEPRVTKSATAPTTPATDDLWLDTSVTPHVWKRWTGSAWVKATPTDADEIAESASRKWAGESGADVTQNRMNAGVEITASGGNIRAGKTGFSDATNAGWFIGRDTDGIPKLRVGNNTYELVWNGSNLTIKGTVTIEPGSTGYGNLSDKPPLAQSLWVPANGELFEFREHFSGSKGTLPL